MGSKKKSENTATRTELQTSPDTAIQEALQQAEKSEHALIVIQGEFAGQVHRLKEGVNSIGRHPDSDVVVQQRAVSGQHATITLQAGTAILEDLKSTNGTLVNKENISRPLVLQSGDLIKIGSSVFKYTDRKLDASFTESLHQKVTTDGLTGAYNKAFMQKALASSIEVAKSGYPLSLVVIDLDHFKKINDSYGHLAGDFVLKEVCRVVKEEVIRSEDILGRFGGEEFVLVMPDAPLKTAITVAERIRKTIESHKFEFEGKVIPVTASLGVCTWRPSFENADAMFKDADALLYVSKQNGRNRVSS